MTIVLLTLILLGYMKITGKSLPKLEKRLNRVKNSKKSQIAEMSNVIEKEVTTIDMAKKEKVSFKKNNNFSLYPKTYSGSLRI